MIAGKAIEQKLTNRLTGKPEIKIAFVSGMRQSENAASDSKADIVKCRNPFFVFQCEMTDFNIVMHKNLHYNYRRRFVKFKDTGYLS